MGWRQPAGLLCAFGGGGGGGRFEGLGRALPVVDPVSRPGIVAVLWHA
jgi:hypothetical protein